MGSLEFKKWLVEVGDAVWTTPEKQKPAMYATALGSYTSTLKKRGEENVPAAMKKKSKKKAKKS